MKDVFVIINDKKRTEFEKKWQMPFGYSESENDIYFSLQDAIKKYNKYITYYYTRDFVIEKVNNEGRQIVYVGI